MSENSQTPPATLWTAVLDQVPVHAPLPFGQTLLCAVQPSDPGARHSGLRAFDLATGKPRWQVDFEYAIVSGMQAYRLHDANRHIALIATSSSDLLLGAGALLALDETGAEIWRWQTQAQHYAAPLVHERRVYVAAGGKKLMIVDPETGGDDVTTIPLPVSAALTPPAIAGDVLYLPCRSPDLVAITTTAAADSVLWRFHFQSDRRLWLDKTPLVAGDMVYAVSSRGHLFALERNSGQLAWQVEIGAEQPLSAPVAGGDGALFVGFDQGVAAVDGTNGRLLWTFPTERPVSAAPLLWQETLYCVGEDHFLYALDPGSGVVQWRHELARRIEQSPAATPPALVVADRGGGMVAFELPPAKEAAVAIAPEDAAHRQETAVAHEAAGEPLPAAALWQELGELERAAELYESGNEWLQAAALWQQIDRYGHRAAAYEAHARQLLEDPQASDEDKAVAWEQAARAHAETGQREARRRCEQEVARLRGLPLLTIEIQPEGQMELNAWTKVNYTLHNEGFGAARSVEVKIKDDRFAGEAAHTQTVITLQPGHSYSHWLNVSPRAHGRSVPMQLVIAYSDRANRVHALERTFYLTVYEDIEDRPAPSDSWELPPTLPAPAESLRQLRQNIVEYFNSDELENLILDMGLKSDLLGSDFSTKTRKLIEYAVHAGRLDELVEICRHLRPHVEW